MRGSGLIGLDRMTAIKAMLDAVMNKVGNNEKIMHTAHVAPLSGPTRLAVPNRIRDALIPLYHFIKIIYQKHFINVNVFVIKSLWKRFQFGANP